MVEEVKIMTVNSARVKFESSEGKSHHFKERGGSLRPKLGINI